MIKVKKKVVPTGFVGFNNPTRQIGMEYEVLVFARYIGDNMWNLYKDKARMQFSDITVTSAFSGPLSGTKFSDAYRRYGDCSMLVRAIWNGNSWIHPAFPGKDFCSLAWRNVKEQWKLENFEITHSDFSLRILKN